MPNHYALPVISGRKRKNPPRLSAPQREADALNKAEPSNKEDFTTGEKEKQCSRTT